MNQLKIIFVISFVLFLAGCGKNYTPEQEQYIKEIETKRGEKDNEFRNDPSSPFNAKSKVRFEPLKYYDVDPAFVFKSKLTGYETKDTIKIFGTKGEERKVIRFGFVTFTYKSSLYKVNVYQGISRSGLVYHSIWFTDETTGEETYGVGRYIDFELNPDKNYIYTVDFNLAYNPYCAYSSEYSCAIPTKEDYLPVKITAGEKNYHD